jgi:hypothetical protein
MIDKGVIKALTTFSKTKKEFVKFWEDIDEPIEDIIKLLRIDTNTNIGRIFKTIRNETELSQLLPKNLNIDAVYALTARKRNEKLKEIFKGHIDVILSAYFCSLFGKNFQSQSIWAANNILTKDEQEQTGDNFAAKCFLTYNKNSMVLNDIYYSLVMIKNEQETYKIKTTPQFSGTLAFDKNMLQRILNYYEKRRRNHRSRIKIWWIKDRDEECDIVFRRSLSKSVTIRLWNKNKFQIAADVKTLTIKKNLSTMSLYTKKNKKLMLKYLKQMLAFKSGSTNVEFDQVPFYMTKIKADKLLDNLLRNKGNSARIIEATIINFPVTTNPEVKIRAVGAEGIEEALSDFGRKEMTVDKNYIKNMKIKYFDRYFTLKPTLNGDNMTFEVSGKGISSQVKNEFLKELDRISKI